GTQADADLLPVGQGQPPRPGQPAIMADRPPRGLPHHQCHALMRTAHLRADLPQRQAPWPSAAAPAAAAPPTDAYTTATSSAHRESSRLTEAYCVDCLNPPCHPSSEARHGSQDHVMSRLMLDTWTPL